MRLVAVEDVADQARATGQVHELVGEADQATRGDAVLQAHTATAIGLHVDQFTLALAQGLHHAALVEFFHVGRHQLDRLALLAVDGAKHHARLAHGQLVAFTAHVLQQDGEVQLTAAHHLEDAVLGGL